MTKNITLLCIDDYGRPVKQASFSKKALWALSLFFMAGLIFFGYFVFDYFQKSSSSFKAEKLNTLLESQSALIADQRKQLQAFGDKINELKNNIKALNEFENKIRIIANLKKKEKVAGLFGIGGSLPEDIDTAIPLKKDHNRLLKEMHQQIELVNEASTIQHEGFKSLLIKLKDKRNLLASTPSIWPAKGWISSTFSYRTSPFTGRREFHKGLDIANKMGSPIIAPANGVVTYAKKKRIIGNMLIIDHGYGITTKYGHISKFLKNSGDKVKRGEKIALIGNTGRSTGPHVHYEVHIKGVPVNPQNYILN